MSFIQFMNQIKELFIYTDYIYCLFDELLKIVDKVNFIKLMVFLSKKMIIVR